MKRTQQSLLSMILFAMTTLMGIAAFLYPFWMPALVVNSADAAHAGDSALVLAIVVCACFAVLLLEVQSHAVSAKSIALLGVLVAINSVLRFAEVAIPGPGGFSPIFVLIALGGYVFGARLGFLLGSLTILASALVTGGVGPWMPYQMLTAGWVGMTAPLCRPVIEQATRFFGTRSEVVVLAVFGALWGLLFGAIMNIWFWPYAMGPASMYWEPGIGVVETMQRYAVFYAATSLVWDLMRAAGNAILILLMGEAVLRVLRRFHQRFDFVYRPLPVASAPAHFGGTPQPLPTPVGSEI